MISGNLRLKERAATFEVGLILAIFGKVKTGTEDLIDMMRNSMSKMRKLVIWCGLVNFFWCFGGIVLAMPHHEPSHVLESEQESSSNEGNFGDANHQNNYLPPSTQVVSQEESFEVVDPDPSAAFDVT